MYNIGRLVGEVEIMIAETSARGQKLGWESICLMLRYGFEHLHIETFEAKIKMDNFSSIAMFEKLKFVETGKKPLKLFFRAFLTLDIF